MIYCNDIIQILPTPEFAPLFTGNEDELSKSFDNNREATSEIVKKFTIRFNNSYL